MLYLALLFAQELGRKTHHGLTWNAPMIDDFHRQFMGLEILSAVLRVIEKDVLQALRTVIKEAAVEIQGT